MLAENFCLLHKTSESSHFAIINVQCSIVVNVWSLIAWALVNSDESRFLQSRLYYLSNVLSMVGQGPRFFRGGSQNRLSGGRYPPIMSIMFMECIKPDLKLLAENTSF